MHLERRLRRVVFGTARAAVKLGEKLHLKLRRTEGEPQLSCQKPREAGTPRGRVVVTASTQNKQLVDSHRRMIHSHTPERGLAPVDLGDVGVVGRVRLGHALPPRLAELVLELDGRVHLVLELQIVRRARGRAS